jgi:imidazolonepropionase-like amidohydrolase
MTRRLTLALSLLVSGSFGAPAGAQQVTVLHGATLIDGTGAAPRPNAVVVVRDGRIAEIADAARHRAPPGSRVLDVTGRYLVPGFIDAHAHVNLGPVSLDAAKGHPTVQLDTAATTLSLRTLLAYGITSIRDPGAPAVRAVSVRERIASGTLLGPRLVTAGEVLDASVFPGIATTVRTEQDVRAEVRRQLEAGVDYIKVYVSLPPPLVSAAIEEAHARGKRVLGHLRATSWTEAARLGIDGIVHSVPSSAKLLGPDRRQAYAGGMARNTRFMFQWFEHVDLASPEIDSMVRAMVEQRVVHDPTLVVFEAMAWGDSARITESPDLALAAPSLLRNWRTAFTLSAGWTRQDHDSARAVWPTVLRLVKMLYDRGVLLAAGTDANNPWVVPGPSFHRELQLLAAAGIPPLEVLRIATRNGAEALGRLDSLGTIERGKVADLVLLDADPSRDITTTRRIAWVMRDGVIHRPRELLPLHSLRPGRSR